MTMTLERYSGVGYDYLVLDTKNNERELSSTQITKILNRSLKMGADGLLVGPMLIDGKLSAKAYGENGEETVMDPVGKLIFSRYLLDAGYVKEKKKEENSADVFVSGTIKIYD